MSFFNHRIPLSSSSSFDKAILDDYQTKTDSNLKTSDKTIVGAINSTKTQIDNANSQISDANAQINNAKAQIDNANTEIGNANSKINNINVQISSINTQINSTISEADINTIINNALK